MIGDRWQQVLDKHGDAVALHHAAGKLTFAQLDREARALKHSDDYVLAQGGAADLLRALLAGALHGKPVQVAEKDRARRVPACPIPAGTYLIKQTVGGSGHRRCQFFTAAQILTDVDRIHAALKLEENKICVAAISPAHSYGLTVTVLQTLLHGLPLHWLAEPFPASLATALAGHSRVFLPGIPALWRAWLQAGVPFGKVSLALSAGSPLTLELERRAWEMSALKLHNLYGTSECGAVAYDASKELRSDVGDVGDLLPGVTALIDEEGLLVVQSTSVGTGYDELLPGEIFDSNRFRTCDKAELNGSRLYFRGSAGAGINVAGRKLSPDEIAAKLRAATGVKNLEVHGAPSRDPERCQEVVALVGLPASELTPAFRGTACLGLAPWEIPRRWVAQEDPGCEK
ncbi:MAG: AMP-binding enzyme [Verrucomicrobiaceae bacterium]|nr:AMP-binding enzyme [Verrucomicrobiaceae bacterium]